MRAQLPDPRQHVTNVTGMMCGCAWLQVQRQAAWDEHEAAVDIIRLENEAAVDTFLRALNRPITPQERDICLRAQAGLDIPEDNTLRLRPHSAAAKPEPKQCAPARMPFLQMLA